MLAQILSSIVTCLSTLMSGVAGALTSGFETVFVEGTGANQTLSVTGTWIIAIFGIALTLGIFSAVIRLCRAKG